MDRDPPSLLGAALDLVIDRDHDRTADGRYRPLSTEDRIARLEAAPGHPSEVACTTALERVRALLECAEVLGILFHQGKPGGPEALRTEYRAASEGFSDDEVRLAYWEGVTRMRK